jgi:hypothetical protein
VQMPKTEGESIIRLGTRVPVGFRVRTFQETGYVFPSRMRATTRMVILHGTGAENPPSQVYENLLRHKSALGQIQPLSIHFVIDQKGVIYQMADVESRCAHCAGIYKDFSPNAVSIGIELIGRLTDFRKVPDKGVVRMRMRERIHGVEMDVDEMLPAQCDAAAMLCETLCALYKLPLRVPESKDGAVSLEMMSEKDASSWTGCAGHLHFAGKPDPCRLTLRAIQERGKLLRA